jgi:endonuclease YncB( thermonuclease family)
MKSIFKKSTTALAISLFAVSFAKAGPITYDSPMSTSGFVYRVIDADTFVINIEPDAYERVKRNAEGDEDRERYLNDRFNSIRVRLANVDTPESAHREESRNTEMGSFLSSRVTNMIEKENVGLRCHDFGVYGRIICNVGFVDESGEMLDLGGYLIGNGYSPYVTHFGESPYHHEVYQQLERSARPRY